ncbi:hypothetical protein [Nocardia flavorosea]|uniref:Lipoprotein LpqN n=1 Tax=Nocardia flavorosea TaxID=53429 RepID=A0A846YMG2_9NOCA|nr:hypothetical protein [Nocardia flavorosea]NKY58448.1 hypothetical protein [Nocardia flavorosea]
MVRSGFFRIGIGAAVAAFVLAVLTAIFPAAAAAQDAPPAIALSATASGTTIDYTVTNIPNRRDTFPVIPGECTTVLVNTAVAAPILAPAAVDTLSGREPDAFALLQRLIADGAVTAGPRVQFATAGQVTGSFTDIPRGVYLVATVCNVSPLSGEFRPELLDIVPVVVTDLRSGSAAPAQ